MMFPTANSVIYRNEDGEVLGWDTDYGYEPDYDPTEDFDQEEPYFETMAACIEAGFHYQDGDYLDDATVQCNCCPGTWVSLDKH